MNDLLGQLPHSAAFYPYRLDPESGLVELLHVDRAFYRQASFLDERALAGRRVGGWRQRVDEIDAALAAAPAAERPLRWIFHIGHCGSTLISRTLDGLPGVLGLREPLPLLALAAYATEIDTPLARLSRDAFDRQLATMRRLLARGFTEDDITIVKPTSVCSLLAERLIGADDRAVLLSVALPVYLATMLRDPELRAGARRDALPRLAAYLARVGDDGTRLHALSDAETIALTWLVEQDRFLRLSSQADGRVSRIDFDHWLCDPQRGLDDAAARLALTATPVQRSAALDDARLDRYAKNPAQPYDAERRRAELAAASNRHAEEIAAGRRYAGRVLERHAGRWRVPEIEL